MFEGQQGGGEALRNGSGLVLTATRFTSPRLSSEERHSLESAALPARAVKAQTELVREGERSDQLYVIAEGWLCHYKTTRDGSRQIIAVLVPGDVANLDALTLGYPGFGVRALTIARLVPFPCDRVLALAERHAGIATMLMRLAMIENSIFGEWALGLGRRSAQQRLAHLICELAVRLAGDNPETASFDMPLTQEQLGDALGLTAVHVNRTLQQLRTDGLLESASRTITLPDVRRLRQLAEFNPSYLHLGSANRPTNGRAVPTPSDR